MPRRRTAEAAEAAAAAKGNGRTGEWLRSRGEMGKANLEAMMELLPVLQRFIFLPMGTIFFFFFGFSDINNISPLKYSDNN